MSVYLLVYEPLQGRNWHATNANLKEKDHKKQKRYRELVQGRNDIFYQNKHIKTWNWFHTYFNDVLFTCHIKSFIRATLSVNASTDCSPANYVTSCLLWKSDPVQYVWHSCINTLTPKIQNILNDANSAKHQALTQHRKRFRDEFIFHIMFKPAGIMVIDFWLTFPQTRGVVHAQRLLFALFLFSFWVYCSLNLLIMFHEKGNFPKWDS